MNAKREVRDANAERRGAATIAFCGRRPGRRAPWRARTLDAPRRRVRTPSLNRGTPTALDPDGRVVRQVRVAPAAHDACVVR
jgi:hypothetical protein